MSHTKGEEDLSVQEILALPYLQPGTPEHIAFWRPKPRVGVFKAAVAEAAALEGPTWIKDISTYFTPGDVNCMKSTKRFDLSVYDDVVLNRYKIFGLIRNKKMPPGRPWDSKWVDNLFEWIVNACPYGTELPARVASFALAEAAPPRVSRLRKNLRELDRATEVEKLKHCFREMMKKDPKDPHSYFALAGIHGRPDTPHCSHHYYGFYPWHRIYNLEFENAMRLIPGCEDITLPYWDQASKDPIPEWVWEEPFASYTWQVDVDQKQAGTPTRRASYKNFLAYMEQWKISDIIFNTFEGPSWEEFGDWHRIDGGERIALEKAHDLVHNWTGRLDSDTGTRHSGEMADTSYAAFDPIFWFQHSDYDRIVWEWQLKHGATTEDGFRRKCKEGQLVDFYLKEGHLPWHSGERIEDFAKHLDLHNFKLPEGVGIGYTAGSCSPSHPRPRSAAAAAMSLAPAAVHLPVEVRAKPYVLSARPQQKVIWVNNVDRRNIAGSFCVQAYAQEDGHADRTLIGTEYVLQFNSPALCKRCVEKPLATFAFRVPHQFSDKAEYSVEIWNAQGDPVDLSNCGTPTMRIEYTLSQ